MSKFKISKKIAAISAAMVMAVSASAVALPCSAASWSVNPVIKTTTVTYTNGSGGKGVYSECTYYGGSTTLTGYFASRTHSGKTIVSSAYTTSLASGTGVSVTYSCNNTADETRGTVTYYV